MAVDYGVRRLGIALSDPTRIIASPHATLVRRAGKRPPWTDLMRLIEENDVSEVVIGLPLDLEGEEGDWAAEVREFGNSLAGRCRLPIHWVDERMTSVQAERAVRGSGLKKKQREEKGRVDAAAAALILQAYLQQVAR